MSGRTKIRTNATHRAAWTTWVGDESEFLALVKDARSAVDRLKALADAVNAERLQQLKSSAGDPANARADFAAEDLARYERDFELKMVAQMADGETVAGSPEDVLAEVRLSDLVECSVEANYWPLQEEAPVKGRLSIRFRQLDFGVRESATLFLESSDKPWVLATAASLRERLNFCGKSFWRKAVHRGAPYLGAAAFLTPLGVAFHALGDNRSEWATIFGVWAAACLIAGSSSAKWTVRRRIPSFEIHKNGVQSRGDRFIKRAGAALSALVTAAGFAVNLM